MLGKNFNQEEKLEIPNKKQKIDEDAKQKKIVVDILQLPTEILEKILAYVSEESMFLTCKKFNEIGSRVSFFNLKFISPEYPCAKFSRLDDISGFASMMKSNRRFKQLDIAFHNTFRPLMLKTSSVDRLTQIIERFGKDVKMLKLCHIILPSNFVELLNFMPNLKEAYFVKCVDESLIGGKLELHKLEKIETSSCQLDVLRYFDELPPGVLQEIEVKNIQARRLNDVKAPIKLFQNQRNVKKMEVDCSAVDHFDFKQTKLKELEFHVGDVNDATSLMEQVLTGQDEIETFETWNLNEAALNIICKELKSLVNLFFYNDSAVNLGVPWLTKLRKLKNLSIETYSDNSADMNNFLSFTRNESLKKLTLECLEIPLSELAVTQIGINFPNLKELTLESKSPINYINLVLQNCKNLELLSWYLFQIEEPEVYTFPDDLSHKNLKSLQIGEHLFGSFESLPKLVGCCNKLEILNIELNVDEQTLIEILATQPNLKSLTVDSSTFRRDINFAPKTTRATFKAIKELGKNLELFRCYGFVLSDGIDQEMVEEEFKDRFKKVETWGRGWELNNL